MAFKAMAIRFRPLGAIANLMLSARRFELRKEKWLGKPPAGFSSHARIAPFRLLL